MSDGVRISRRRILRAAAAGIGAVCLPSISPLLGGGIPAATEPATQPGFNTQRYKISVCDWMLLKRQKVSALQLAKACGMDGVEVDMGRLGTADDMDDRLRDPEQRRQYLETSRRLGVEISSLALSAFYGQSYVEHPKADQFTDEWIQIMHEMGVKVGFLPMGIKCNIKEDLAARRKVVEHLKRAAPAAEKAGVVMGLETALDADGHKRLLDDIGSPAVAVYYNLGDAMEAGYDIDQEIRALGRDRICQFHCKEGNVWLGQGRINFPKVKATLDDIGWSGWLVVERSRVPGKSVEENYTANAKYLKSLFQAH